MINLIIYTPCLKEVLGKPHLQCTNLIKKATNLYFCCINGLTSF